MDGSWQVAVAAVCIALPANAMSINQNAEIRLAEARGAAIAAHDRAAWVATDAMLAAINDPGREGIRGYMVVADGSDLRVIFYGDSAQGHVPIYEAMVHKGTIAATRLVPLADRQPLNAGVERLIRARNAVSGLAYPRCNQASMNMVVFPAETGGDTIVYLLTAQMEGGVYPVGGHYRIIVSDDGKVISRRAFTKSCLTLSAKDGPAGAKGVGVFVTHLLDPYPTEIHAWLSRWMGVPVIVGTSGGRMWPVTDGKIGEPVPLKQ